MPGFFLVVEGPEGAGKSTLARALGARLAARGADPVLVREPGGTPVAEALRAELLGGRRAWTPEAELLYVAAARADLVANVIRPALEAGRIVVSDRFDLSTVCYQVVGRGLPAAMVDWVNRGATGGLTPDLVLVLDVPPNVGQARQAAAGKTLDRLDREPPGFHARVVEAYRLANGPGVRHLDATALPEALAEAAWTLVSAALDGAGWVAGRSALPVSG